MSFFDTEATVAAFELTFSARTTLTTNQVLNANAFTYRNLQKNSNSIIPLDNICVTYSKNGNVELWIKAPSTYFWLRAFINYSSSLPSFDWYGSDKVVDELNSPDIVQIIKPVLGGGARRIKYLLFARNKSWKMDRWKRYLQKSYKNYYTRI